MGLDERCHQCPRWKKASLLGLVGHFNCPVYNSNTFMTQSKIARVLILWCNYTYTFPLSLVSIKSSLNCSGFNIEGSLTVSWPVACGLKITSFFFVGFGGLSNCRSKKKLFSSLFCFPPSFVLNVHLLYEFSSDSLRTFVVVLLVGLEW